MALLSRPVENALEQKNEVFFGFFDPDSRAREYARRTLNMETPNRYHYAQIALNTLQSLSRATGRISYYRDLYETFLEKFELYCNLYGRSAPRPIFFSTEIHAACPTWD